tara:strand:- start:544 stop:930 length:387 start_codon:yes stop_codon:yes gene_type:complete
MTIQRAVLSAAVVGATLWFPVAQGGDMLTGDDISATLTGSTLLGTALGGGDYKEFFAADGTITMTTKDGLYEGQWSVADDRVCVVMVLPPIDDCWSVVVEGDAITLIGQDGRIDYEKTIIARGQDSSD